MAGKRQRTVNLSDVMELLNQRLSSNLCRAVFNKERTAQRERKWSLYFLVHFWITVTLRQPKSLTQAVQAARRGDGGLWARVRSSQEGLSQRCQSLHWNFFHQLYQSFTASLMPDAPRVYASHLGGLWQRFPEIRIVDGSKCDAIKHRLKLLWKEKRVILPGCLTAFYDLARGITTELLFCPDAAEHELPRAEGALTHMPLGTLLLGDRLYALPEFFRKLSEHGHWGLFRRNKRIQIKTIKVLSRKQGSRTFLEDSLVKAGSGQGGPKVTLRLIRYRRGKVKMDLVTSVVDPKLLRAQEALTLYPCRWRIERLFLDLKETLNLHRFYGANTNVVGMQAYAVAMVHTALRIAQANIAMNAGIMPEDISPTKLFPKLAELSRALAEINIYKMDLARANPGVSLVEPSIRKMSFANVTLAYILVEKRKGKRKKRKFNPLRRRWKSLAHVSGFQN